MRFGRTAPIWLVFLLTLGACGASDLAGPAEPLRIYTSVTQDTVDAVIEGFKVTHPDAEIEVFRAPTGELTARVAAELREGGIQADIFWLTDPLSIQQYSADRLLRSWAPSEIESVPRDYRTEDFFGTRILNMIIVAGSDIDNPPVDWDDLTSGGSVAIPDPGFAGSAYGALAFFALNPDYGIEFYEALKANGGVQVKAPGDVITGVAEGIYEAGMTLDSSANLAIADGSPLQLVWPSSGAIAIYSPIAVLDESPSPDAEPFVDYVLSVDGQTRIADTGWQPVRSEVPWTFGGPQVAIDWALAFNNQTELLDKYRSIFEG